MTTAFQALKAIISKSGMSAPTIAEQTHGGVTSATINNWMSGRVREARTETMSAVAAVFGMKLELRMVSVRPIATAAPIERRPVPRMAVWLRS